MRSKNLEEMHHHDAMKLRLRKIDRETTNIVNILTDTGSKALANILRELEHEKTELEYNLSISKTTNMTFDYSAACISEAFSSAKSLYKKGQLASIRRPVELAVGKITIYKEKIHIAFSLGLLAHAENQN